MDVQTQPPNVAPSTRIADLLKELPAPAKWIGHAIDLFGMASVGFFLAGFFVMNLFVYFDYVPWGRFINYRGAGDFESTQTVEFESRRGAELEQIRQQNFRLSGTVQDSSKGLPISNALISARKNEGSSPVSTRSTTDGKYSLDLTQIHVIAGDDVEVRVDAAGFGDFSTLVPVRQGYVNNFTLRPNEPVTSH